MNGLVKMLLAVLFVLLAAFGRPTPDPTVSVVDVGTVLVCDRTGCVES